MGYEGPECDDCALLEDRTNDAEALLLRCLPRLILSNPGGAALERDIKCWLERRVGSDENDHEAIPATPS